MFKEASDIILNDLINNNSNLKSSENKTIDEVVLSLIKSKPQDAKLVGKRIEFTFKIREDYNFLYLSPKIAYFPKRKYTILGNRFNSRVRIKLKNSIDVFYKELGITDDYYHMNLNSRLHHDLMIS